MKKTSKNPLVIGLLNALVPGSCFVLVEKNLGKFIMSFVGGIILLALMYIIGSGIQQTENYSLPQGLAPLALILVAMVPLFWIGMRTTREHNVEINAQIRFKAQRELWQAGKETRYKTIFNKKDDTGKEKVPPEK